MENSRTTPTAKNRHDAWTSGGKSPTHIAVHRQSNTIYYKRIDPEGHRMLAAIGRGRSLLQAVQSAFKGSSIPKSDRADYVRDSFANWTVLGWFYAS